MPMDTKKQEKFEPKPALETPLEQLHEADGEVPEGNREVSERDLAQLRQKVEQDEHDDRAKLRAADQAQNSTGPDNDGKVKELLETAKKKGAVYALGVAEKMNNAYLLDRLRDELAKNGLYHDFPK